MADAILTDRAERGDFRSAGELSRVRGVGPKLVERLRGQLECRPTGAAASGGGGAQRPPAPESPHRPGAPVVRAQRPTGPRSGAAAGPGTTAPPVLDLNSADVEELTALPGIGPVLAARIVAHRVRHGPFRTFSELKRIKGLSGRRGETLRPFVQVK
ncbi:MAG: helix-hairpin-helix domain-containing protein [Candidatus Riflebacteria bacterium]|nr:helix-hairpin-helix domain-containing protein [Candidatus Riflebacteria bacterium]